MRHCACVAHVDLVQDVVDTLVKNCAEASPFLVEFEGVPFDTPGVPSMKEKFTATQQLDSHACSAFVLATRASELLVPGAPTQLTHSYMS